MKKLILMFTSLFFVLSTPATVFTLGGLTFSQPKLMVEKYTMEGDYIIPGETKVITIIFKNTSKKKAIKNIKLSFSEESGQILPSKMGTKFVRRINKDREYKWRFDISAIQTAESKPYAATITMEYEDSQGRPIIATDVIYLYVRQPVRLEYEKIEFPARVTQSDAVPFSVKLMNMGKGNIVNALLTYDIPGLNNGSSVLIGTILPGESKTGTANFRVDKDMKGEVSGKLIISYEDEYGESYQKEIELKTYIEENTFVNSGGNESNKQETNKNNLWPVYVIGGIAVVAAAVFFGRRYIKERDQMKADEMKL